MWPLTRLFPCRNGGLGFFPELRTPASRTCWRTSERGPTLNTGQELRIRQDRPPICEFTRIRECQGVVHPLRRSRSMLRHGGIGQYLLGARPRYLPLAVPSLPPCGHES